MKKPFSIYICLLVLLGSIICEPTIILAEALNATDSTQRTTETLASSEAESETIDSEKHRRTHLGQRKHNLRLLNLQKHQLPSLARVKKPKHLRH